jgi:putative alpha-1,2-mannosidase
MSPSLRSSFPLLTAVVAAIIAFCMGISNPEEYPSLLAGSFTDGNRFSTGNTLPLVGMPWGFNHWSPQTRDAGRMTGSWWFNGNDHQLTWLRCTHQPSPWIGDWGFFLFIPQYGRIERSPVQYWEPRGAILKPYLLDTLLAPHNIRVQLTPTDHGAYVQVTFPKTSEQKYFCMANLQWGDQGNSANGGNFITGRSTQVHSERMIVNKFALNMRAESAESIEIKGSDDLKCFKYDPHAEKVSIRISTSLISAKQAVTSLERELSHKKSFDEVLHDAKSTWNRLDC